MTAPRVRQRGNNTRPGSPIRSRQANPAPAPSELSRAVFAQKLRGLFEESKIPQKKLAEFIQNETAESITRQSIGQWCLGKSCPR